MNTPVHFGIVMVGSANMDVVFAVERIPAPGETLLATSIARYPGGKGLNQAVAAARSGVDTTFIGAVGHDKDGDALFSTMADSRINTSLVRRVQEDSGQAFIVVAESAENTIIVASGANAGVTKLTPDEILAVQSASVLLMQLELPLDVVLEAARAARIAGTLVMLNAAPARELPGALLDLVDYLMVNEHEACLVGGSEDLDEASATLASRVPQVIVTVGAQGSVIYQHGRLVTRLPSRKVVAVDTTGAGDTYCGAFAAAIAEGGDVISSAEFATAAAALSVQVLGAVPSIPTRERIDAMLSEPA